MKKLLPFLALLIFLLIGKVSAQCVNPTGGSISGPTTGCTDRVASYTVSGVNNATGYTWNISGAANFSKVSDTEYSIVYGTSTVTITVTPTNGSCTGTPLTTTVTVTSAPSKPLISQTSNTLTSTTAAFYQWYLNDALITGATSQTYTPTESGVYKVEVKAVADGCSSFSDGFNYYTTAIGEDKKFQSFTFYPNPVQTTLNTNFNTHYDLEFYDLMGRKVLVNKDLMGAQQTNLTSLNKGLYLMRIISDGKKATRKILIK
ncbi:MAG: T9SS type A sorting domain-containing protein [Sphingobacteriales bacterium]|nr:T9SS type A sorting domain-containing protein [Sphingobacteriales bacterium]